MSRVQSNYDPEAGAYSHKKDTYSYENSNNNTFSNDFGKSNFDLEHGPLISQASVRLGFIRKVYTILSLQLAVTVLMCSVFMFHDPATRFVLNSPGMWITALILPIILLLGLFCFRKSYPVNSILLALFTVAESYTLGVVCAMYKETGRGVIVFEALLLTGIVFCSLTIYCFVTKRDFSFLGAGLSCGLMVLIFWGLLAWVFPGLFGHVASTVYALFGALLFCGYILFDTSMIINRLDPDEYIIAAIDLYLDIINLFLFILRLLDSR